MRRLLAPLLALGLIVPLPLAAQAPAPVDRAQIEAIIRDYLMKNPEILEEMMSELQRRQTNAAETSRKDVFSSQREALFRPTSTIVLGNPDGDVTLVEFFDYNCGYCKRAFSTLKELIRTDSRVRLVLRDFPVLGPGSVEAAQVAVAYKMQSNPVKFLEFHEKLLMGRGQANRSRALEVAREVGADMARLEQDMQLPSVRAALADTAQLGDKLRITGTPSYAIGSELVEGAVELSVLREQLNMARTACKTQSAKVC